jgi:hypothetical protein
MFAKARRNARAAPACRPDQDWFWLNPTGRLNGFTSDEMVTLE